jgi:uncharacterized damage-inducible protein DinB
VSDPRAAPLAAMLELNTALLLNCLDGLSEGEACRRLPGGGNSIAFLAAHLADSRHFLAAALGHPLANPLAPALEQARSIDEVGALPPLHELRGIWRAVSGPLQSVVASIRADALDRPAAQRVPVSDPSVLGMVAFLVQHDSYHLGQVAFIRRQLGKPAMSYVR